MFENRYAADPYKVGMIIMRKRQWHAITAVGVETDDDGEWSVVTGYRPATNEEVAAAEQARQERDAAEKARQVAVSDVRAVEGPIIDHGPTDRKAFQSRLPSPY